MILNIFSQTFIWGRFSDRHQLRRTLILWGEFAGAMGTVAVWGAHTLTQNRLVAGYVIICGLAIVEIFWSMSNIGWSALISDLYPERQRGDVQGRLASIGGLGRLAGIWIGGLLYDGLGHWYPGWGFRSGTLFFIPAFVMLISMIPVFYLPEGGARRLQETVRDCDAACEAASIRLFWLFLVAMTFINFGRNCVVIIQSQYLFLPSGFHVSSRLLSYVFNTETAAIILFGLLAGRICRRIGNGRAICLGAAAAVVYLVLYIVSDNLKLIFVASFFKGAADVVLVSASYALASILIPPERRGRLFGIFNATLFLSWGVAGTVFAGPIVDWMIASGFTPVLAYRAAYLSGLILTVIGLAVQLVLVFVMLPKAKGINPHAFR